MWIGHWFVGIGFYVLANVAIWIEGCSRFSIMLLCVYAANALMAESLLNDHPTYQTFLQAPLQISNVLDTQFAIGLSIFIAGAVVQNRAHAYLWSLRKTGTYSFPTHPLFFSTLTPHYFSECAEYFGLAIAAAPRGQYLNRTIVAALIFVAVNLGVTANETYEWYATRFGQDKVKGKARMLPLIW